MPERSAKEIWQSALGALQVQASAAVFNTWLRPSYGLSFADGEFVVGVPSSFTAEWLEQRMLPLLERTVSDILGAPIRVSVLVPPTASEDPATHPLASDDSVEPPVSSPRAGAPRGYRPALALGSRPDPQLTFDRFVVGDNTKLAYAAASAVARDHDRAYNPLVVYGDPGLGKTHLLHAIAHEAQERQRTTLLATAEDFVNDYVTSVQEHTTNEFRDRYRSPDVLVIDDLQFICGKTRSEERLAITCNALMRAGRQVVFSADRAPADLPFTDARLLSRLQAGLPVEVRPPDYGTRLAIIAFKAARTNTEVPDEVIHYLAARPRVSVRRVEAELTRLVAHATLLGEPVTLQLATETLGSRGTRHENGAPDAQTIIHATAAYYGYTPDDLKGKNRERGVTNARQLAMYLVRTHTTLSLRGIAQQLGQRDYRTILYGAQQITQRMTVNPLLKESADSIMQVASSTVPTR